MNEKKINDEIFGELIWVNQWMGINSYLEIGKARVAVIGPKSWLGDPFEITANQRSVFRGLQSSWKTTRLSVIKAIELYALGRLEAGLLEDLDLEIMQEYESNRNLDQFELMLYDMSIVVTPDISTSTPQVVIDYNCKWEEGRGVSCLIASETNIDVRPGGFYPSSEMLS